MASRLCGFSFADRGQIAHPEIRTPSRQPTGGQAARATRIAHRERAARSLVGSLLVGPSAPEPWMPGPLAMIAATASSSCSH